MKMKINIKIKQRSSRCLRARAASKECASYAYHIKYYRLTGLIRQSKGDYYAC